MRVVNRLLAVVLALVLLVASALTALVASNVLARREITSRWSYAPAAGVTHDLATLNGTTRTIVVVVAVVVAVLMLILFLSEFRILGSIFDPLRRRGRAIPLPSTGPGVTSVLIGSLDDMVQRSVSAIPGVVEARARVSERAKGGISVFCDASVDPSVELPVLGPTVEHRITEFLTAMAGLTVQDVRVRISLGAQDAERPQTTRRSAVR